MRRGSPLVWSVVAHAVLVVLLVVAAPGRDAGVRGSETVIEIVEVVRAPAS